MKLRVKNILIGFCIVIGLAGTFGSCDLFNSLTGNTVTAPERVQQFAAGVTSGAWGTLQSHFYGPGSPQEYDAMNTGEDYWINTLFYDATAITITGEPAGDATQIEATMVGGATYELVFSLKQNPDDKNYYITLIDLVGYDNADDIRRIGY